MTANSVNRGTVKERWLPVGIVAAVLFAINLIGRIVARFLEADGPEQLADREVTAGAVAFGAIVVTFMIAAIVWGRNRPLGQVVADLFFAGVVGCALSIFIAPLLVGISPFSGGAGQFFGQIWWYGGLGFAGSLLGILVLMAIGKDYRARQLKLFAERSKAKPRRV